MTRCCLSMARGYCFCEFCIASTLTNAYVEANNCPLKPINFKNYKKCLQLSPLEIYFKSFCSPEANNSINLNSNLNTPANTPNQVQLEKEINDENQHKFLRILSNKLTQIAEQQTNYFLNEMNNTEEEVMIPSLGRFKLDSITNSNLMNRRLKATGGLKMTRLRSSISESSGYETADFIESPQLLEFNSNSAGVLFNASKVKFGPEDILSTTNPKFLFDSNRSNSNLLAKKINIKKIHKKKLMINNKKIGA